MQVCIHRNDLFRLLCEWGGHKNEWKACKSGGGIFGAKKNAHEVQSCVGLFQYFRKFIYVFSRMAKPLTNLTKKDVVFKWTDVREHFYNWKINWQKRLFRVLMTQTGKQSYIQMQACKVKRMMENFIQLHIFWEAKYHSFELETLAIVYALKRFRMMLEGIHSILVTDCNSLALTLNKKRDTEGMNRWSMSMRWADNS